MDSRFHLSENFVSEYENRLVFFKVLLFDDLFRLNTLSCSSYRWSSWSLFIPYCMKIWWTFSFLYKNNWQTCSRNHTLRKLFSGRSFYLQTKSTNRQRSLLRKITGEIKETRLKWSRDEQQDLSSEITVGLPVYRECCIHCTYTEPLKERRKIHRLPSTQQYNRSISATLLPAVAAFDKKPHIWQNIFFFLNTKKKREEEATRRISSRALAMHTIICLTSFREL